MFGTNDHAAKIPMALHKLFNSISSTIMHVCRNSQRRNSQNDLIYLTFWRLNVF
jgi:hypothetical protein